MRFLWFIIFCSVFVFGEVKQVNVTSDTIDSGIKVIDIRTEKEWENTGVVPNSILITFFNEDQSYDTKKFLEQLDKVVSKDEPFALLCATGNRTNMVSRFLDSEGYNVTNLRGGITKLQRDGYKLQRYTK